MDDLIAFLCKEIDVDEALANRWLFEHGDQRIWKVVGGRRLSYANGSCEHVTAIDVDNVAVIFNEQIYVKGDLDDQSEHIARHDPARVLREVAAKRQIIKLHGPTPEPEGGFMYPKAAKLCDTCGPGDEWRAEREPYGAVPCQTLRLLASVYSDRPGYLPEWAV